jgi:hypothetical protein
MTKTQLEKEPLSLQESKVYFGHCSYSNVALSSPSPWPLFHNYFLFEIFTLEQDMFNSKEFFKNKLISGYI